MCHRDGMQYMCYRPEYFVAGDFEGTTKVWACIEEEDPE